MLAATDVLLLPRGVRAEDGRLADDVRGVSVAMNPAALLVVSGAGRPLAEIAEELGAAFAVPRARALDDVLAFVWQLNRLGLADVRQRAGALARTLAWLVLALRLLPAGTVPPTLVRRRALDTSRPHRAAGGVILGLARRALAVGAATAAVLVPPVSVLGRPALLAALVLGAGTAAALLLHEAAHAAVLAGAAPAALLVSWRRISVLHGPLGARRAAVVALAGPLAPAVAGVAVGLVAVRAAAPEAALAALPLAAHAVGLTLLTTDGRKACGT